MFDGLIPIILRRVGKFVYIQLSKRFVFEVQLVTIISVFRAIFSRQRLTVFDGRPGLLGEELDRYGTNGKEVDERNLKSFEAGLSFVLRKRSGGGDGGRGEVRRAGKTQAWAGGDGATGGILEQSFLFNLDFTGRFSSEKSSLSTGPRSVVTRFQRPQLINIGDDVGLL